MKEDTEEHMGQDSYRSRKAKLLLYTVFLFILALSIVLMPIGTGQREKSMIPLIMAGALFWIGLIGTITTAVHINISRRKSSAFKEKYPDLRKFGPIHFFQNTPAAVTDIALFISVILLLCAKFFGDNLTLQFIAIALVVFTAAMHCMLNGVNYIYLKYVSKRGTES